MLYKINRDLARLYCIKRDKNNAMLFHEKAEKILKNEVFKGVNNNIKICKMALLRGVWMGKLDT